MLSYCLKFRKSTESKDQKAVRAKNRLIMVSTKCEVCDGKISKFIKEQETSGLFNNFMDYLLYTIK